jgi:phage gp29-like protein
VLTGDLPAADVRFPDQAALEQLLDSIDAGTLNAQMAGVLQPLIDLAERDPQAALDRIASALPDVDDDTLQNALARLMFVASAWGAYHA